eukprot:1366012-Amorphochlora_amoeboformis.AAC.1
MLFVVYVARGPQGIVSGRPLSRLQSLASPIHLSQICTTRHRVTTSDTSVTCAPKYLDMCDISE